MNLKYHAPFTINPIMKILVKEKLMKIENLNLRFSEADVYFKLKEGTEPQKEKELEIKMHVPGQVLFAKSHSDTFEKAISLTVEKIRRQILKYKKNIKKVDHEKFMD